MTVHLVTGHSGEVHVTAAEQGALNAHLWGPECYWLTGTAISIVDNNTVHIAEGVLLLNGRHVNINDGGDDVSIETGTVGQYRRDLICYKYSMDELSGVEKVTLEVIKGEYGDGYTTPTVDQQSILDGANPCLVPAYTVDIDNQLVLQNAVMLLPKFQTYFTAVQDVIDVKEQCLTELDDKVSDVDTQTDAIATAAIASVEAEKETALAAISSAWNGDEVSY